MWHDIMLFRYFPLRHKASNRIYEQIGSKSNTDEHMSQFWVSTFPADNSVPCYEICRRNGNQEPSSDEV